MAKLKQMDEHTKRPRFRKKHHTDPVDFKQLHPEDLAVLREYENEVLKVCLEERAPALSLLALLVFA
jgi:hypothetical protein